MPFDRILVIVTAQLGDALICTPLIHAARQQWPQARIDVLGFAGTLDLLAGNPDVSGLIEVARHGNLKAHWHDLRRLWRRYDLALVTRTSDRAHLYGLVAARVRSALLPGGTDEARWKRRLTRHGFTAATGVHQVLEKLQLLSPWMAAPPALSLRAPVAAALPPEIEAQLVRPCVLVHVPSMWRYKQWPTAHYREVIAGLLADGVQVVLTGSGSANDQALIADVRHMAPAPALLDVSGRLSLAQVRALMDRADAYMGPDTSLTHLAAALGLPSVTVYGPTHPQEFGPWPREHPAQQPWARRAQRQEVGPIVMLQGPDLPDRQCVPCTRMGCEDRRDSDSFCLQGLAPQRVLEELRRLLATP